ncbi:MAG: ribosomal protein L7/L12 [Candidatus Thorarchaeota archaeon]
MSKYVNTRALRRTNDCLDILKKFNEMGFFGLTSGNHKEHFVSGRDTDKMLDNVVNLYLTQVVMRLHELSFPQEEEEQEKRYYVRLTCYGNYKIQIIKIIREITGFGLKQSKEFVESVPANIPFDTNTNAIDIENAQKVVNKLKERGATVELIPFDERKTS